MNCYRFKLIIIICILFTGALCGCGVGDNYRSLEQLRVVGALGYDREEGRTVLSVLADAPGEDAPPLRLAGEGRGIREALRNLEGRAGEGQLLFSHARFVAVGSKAASESIEPLLDYAERDEGLRLGAWLFLMEQEASELLMEAGGEEFDAAEALTGARRDFIRAGGHVPDLRETAVALNEYGAAPAALLRVETEDEEVRVTVGGYGIIKGGALVALLRDGEADALGLLRGNPGLRMRETPDGAATLEYEGSAVLRPRWRPDGSPAPLEVRISVNAGVAEGGESASPESLAAALEDMLEADMRGMLELARQLDADFPALGKVLRRDGGRRFYALPSDWLTRMEFDVQAEVTLSRGYDLEDAGEEGKHAEE